MFNILILFLFLGHAVIFRSNLAFIARLKIKTNNLLLFKIQLI